MYSGVLTWCPNRGSEFILGDNSHVFLFEQAGAAQFGGVSPRAVPNLADGTMDINKIKAAIRDDDIHEPITRLIILEQTHNACGGRVISLDYMKKVKALADQHNLKLHLDGARVWNAATALNVSPADLVSLVDSVSVCLSKGLGAPAGSLLVGPKDFIARARRLRKALGGGMRQVGVLAAAGLVGLDDFERGMLKDDHRRAKELAFALKNLSLFEVSYDSIETNIIFATVKNSGYAWQMDPASEVCKKLREFGVYASAWSSHLIRFVTNRDLNDRDILQTIEIVRNVDKLFSVNAKV